MNRSETWLHSREDDMWLNLPAASAAHNLTVAYGNHAGEEALLRVYLAERDNQHEIQRFWLTCFQLIVVKRGGDAAPWPSWKPLKCTAFE